MKLLVLGAFLAVTAAGPQDIQLIKYNVNNDGLGAYNFNFEQSDGTKHEQTGELRNPGSENEFVAVKGSYSWTAPDGHAFMVDYIADEKGFQPIISEGVADALSPSKMGRRTPPVAPNVNTGEMVLSAIKKLMKNTGWTARTIIKFIKMEYRVCDPKISRKVSRALKRGVRLGLLQMEQGRYRLNMMSSLARNVQASEVRVRARRQRLRERPLRVRSRTPSSSSRIEHFRCQRRI